MAAGCLNALAMGFSQIGGQLPRKVRVWETNVCLYATACRNLYHGMQMCQHVSLCASCQTKVCVLDCECVCLQHLDC